MAGWKAAVAAGISPARTQVVRFLNWKEVDGGSIVFIGLASGYVMAILGMWIGRIPGLVSLDIADFGRRYIVSDRPSAWFFGLVSHLINSVLFVWFSRVGSSPPCREWVSWVTRPEVIALP